MQKTCNVSETVQDRIKVTMTDALSVRIKTNVDDLGWPKRTLAEKMQVTCIYVVYAQMSSAW